MAHDIARKVDWAGDKRKVRHKKGKMVAAERVGLGNKNPRHLFAGAQAYVDRDCDAGYNGLGAGTSQRLGNSRADARACSSHYGFLLFD
jgi:hypothetical protein